jgi:serine/threonine protein kinase
MKSATTSHAAEAVIARAWTNHGGADLALARYFQVPFSVLESATHQFSSKMRIGSGGSCDVFRAIVYGVDVAIKLLKQDRNTDVNEDNSTDSVLSLEAKQFFAEMSLLQGVQHPNICRLLAVSMDGPHRWYTVKDIVLSLSAHHSCWCVAVLVFCFLLRVQSLVLQLCAGGALNERIKNQSTLTCLQRLQIAVGIARALALLHSLNMIHCDVKGQVGAGTQCHKRACLFVSGTHVLHLPRLWLLMLFFFLSPCYFAPAHAPACISCKECVAGK